MKAFRKVVAGSAKQGKGPIRVQYNQGVFLKPQEKLTDEQNQARARIAAHFPALETAWKLKEALRKWYAQATVETAAHERNAWITQVGEQGPEQRHHALSACINWKPDMLAFFRLLPTRISNGFVEGTHNRTKAMMRQG